MNGQTTGGVRAGGAATIALARLLQLDDAAGQLASIERSSRAPGPRAVGDRADAPRRLASRPLARDLVDAARHAAAGLEQPLGGHVVGGRPGA